MADRVHVFGGPPHFMADRSIIRRMAMCLTGADVSAEEALAATYDNILGGSDLYVGANMTMLISIATDDREFVERTLMACDLLRQARRTLQ